MRPNRARASLGVRAFNPVETGRPHSARMRFGHTTVTQDSHREYGRNSNPAAMLVESKKGNFASHLRMADSKHGFDRVAGHHLCCSFRSESRPAVQRKRPRKDEGRRRKFEAFPNHLIGERQGLLRPGSRTAQALTANA